ncbi:MAG: glycogen synthase, partial [Candidatus Binatia bacterium]
LGHRVAIFLPLYRSVRRRGVELAAAATGITVPGFGSGFRVFRAPAEMDPAELYLIEHDHFFDRPGLYGYGDDLERFSFFSRAVVEVLAALDLECDVVHCNDWHTGLVPAYLRTLYIDQPRLRSAAAVFTIHNLAYQGRFPSSALPLTGLPWSVFHMDGVEYFGGINLMKAGIAFSNAITTVSPRYAQEITTPEFGEGLDGLLRARAGDLHGILNGIDDQEWNPATDPYLTADYDLTDLSGKRHCRETLLTELLLPLPADTPLTAMVTRLSYQKGCDIVLGVADEILRLGVGFVLLGSGDSGLESGFRWFAGRSPDRVATRIGFDAALAHRIEAGADLFLMPSRYEPCGLNQMYSLRYGTVPVVRATGGLADTVRDPDADPVRPNGFKFRRPWGTDLVQALQRAVAAFRNRQRFERMMRTGMSEDFSWRASARRYSELYVGLR